MNRAKDPVNVVQINRDTNVQERAEILRTVFRDRLQDSDADALIAGVFIGITATGLIRTTIVNIEPEFVAPILREGHAVARKMRDFRNKLRPTGNVIKFAASAACVLAAMVVGISSAHPNGSMPFQHLFADSSRH